MPAKSKGKKNMKRVLISDTLSPEGIEILKNTPGLEVDVMTNLTPDELKGVIKDYDGLAIRSATKVTKEIIEKADNLKVVGRAGIGVDNVDVNAASKRGIVVMNTPGGNTITTGEHSIAMMFTRQADPPGHGLDEVRQVGKEQVHGQRGLQQDPGDHRHRPGGHHRGRPGPGPQDERHRLRPLPGPRDGREDGHHAGHPRRAAEALPLHLRPHAADQGHEERHQRRLHRQDAQRRLHHQLRPRRDHQRKGPSGGPEIGQGGRGRPRRLRRRAHEEHGAGESPPCHLHAPPRGSDG